MPKYCRECGNKIEGDAKFCEECGAKLTLKDSSQINVSDDKPIKSTNIIKEETKRVVSYTYLIAGILGLILSTIYLISSVSAMGGYPILGSMVVFLPYVGLFLVSGLLYLKSYFNILGGKQFTFIALSGSIIGMIYAIILLSMRFSYRFYRHYDTWVNENALLIIMILFYIIVLLFTLKWRNFK